MKKQPETHPQTSNWLESLDPLRNAYKGGFVQPTPDSHVLCATISRELPSAQPSPESWRRNASAGHIAAVMAKRGGAKNARGT